MIHDSQDVTCMTNNPGSCLVLQCTNRLVNITHSNFGISSHVSSIVTPVMLVMVILVMLVAVVCNIGILY